MTTTNNGTSSIIVRLPGAMTAGDFTEALGVSLPLDPDQTLADAVQNTGGAHRVDDVVTIGGVRLEVAQAAAGRIVSLRFHWNGPPLRRDPQAPLAALPAGGARVSASIPVPRRTLMQNLRSKLVTFAAVGAAAVGGATIANAATSSSTAAPSSTSSAQGASMPQGPHTVNGKSETALTGDTAAKVQKAALAKVPGTVDRVETNVDGSAPYEAHVTKSDGTQVEVQVSKDFSVVAVNSMPGHP